MPKFRKKPVVIDAFEWHPGVPWPVEFTLAASEGKIVPFADHLEIATLEGTMRADVGDFVIRGLKGEFYPCKPDIFRASYDPA